MGATRSTITTRLWSKFRGTATAAPEEAVAPDAQREARFERTLDDQVARIAIALVECGPLDREELAERVSADRWGAGRFSAALGAAEHEGHVERVGPNRFGARALTER